MSMDFKKAAISLAKHLENVPYDNGDLSDLGNEIGISIGALIRDDEDLKDLVTGIKHGISLTNGTHQGH